MKSNSPPGFAAWGKDSAANDVNEEKERKRQGDSIRYNLNQTDASTQEKERNLIEVYLK